MMSANVQPIVNLNYEGLAKLSFSRKNITVKNGQIGYNTQAGFVSHDHLASENAIANKIRERSIQGIKKDIYALEKSVAGLSKYTSAENTKELQEMYIELKGIISDLEQH